MKDSRRPQIGVFIIEISATVDSLGIFYSVGGLASALYVASS